MAEGIPVPADRSRDFQRRVAEHLGLDAAQLTGLTVELMGEEPATVTWQGAAQIDRDTLSRLLAEAGID